MAIFNQYRPTKFSEVLGQGIVVSTLRQQAKQQAFHHSYLLFGPSGTGKTTTARILAMVVNCENLQDGEPCCQCHSCQSIQKGSHWDVQEIDGARFRGIDDVKELVYRAFLFPFVGKYKVYIIDECHMLTEPAWNGLLKLLEEPPPHLVIILCTTNKDKIPVTAISRCQLYPFHILDRDSICTKIDRILVAEKTELKASDKAFITELACGNMRQAENALEQSIVMVRGR